MNRKVTTDLLKLLVGVSLLLGGLWAVFAWMPESWRSSMGLDEKWSVISYEDEAALAEMVKEEIMEAPWYEPEEDSLVLHAMNVIAARLLDATELTEYDYEFTLIQSEEINAFATIGGQVYVFTGLLSFADSPEEVAAVLAHEMGHVEKRHPMAKLVQEFGTALLFTLAGGSDAYVISDLAHSLLNNSFSRAMEVEADAYGLALMERAGISPMAAAHFFRKLNKEQLGFDERLEFLSTHPHNNARIKSATTYDRGETFEERPFELDWTAVQARLSSSQ